MRQPRPGCERMRHRTCCSTFIASCGVMAPLVISSSKESVSAMPILDNEWVLSASVTTDRARRTHEDPR